MLRRWVARTWPMRQWRRYRAWRWRRTYPGLAAANERAVREWRERVSAASERFTREASEVTLEQWRRAGERERT